MCILYRKTNTLYAEFPLAPPWPSARWKIACFLEMQCEVSAQPSLGVGGALDMLRKVQWPWHHKSPGCSSGSGSLSFSSQSLFIPEREGAGLGIIDSSPKLPHSFIYLYLSRQHPLLVYKIVLTPFYSFVVLHSVDVSCGLN